MRRQHDVGMRGGNRGVENRAQQGASVGHGFKGIWDRNMGCRLSIRSRQKKTPANAAQTTTASVIPGRALARARNP
jgi:hypothetical protein